MALKASRPRRCGSQAQGKVWLCLRLFLGWHLRHRVPDLLGIKNPSAGLRKGSFFAYWVRSLYLVPSACQIVLAN
jgi:hypothetical protein